MKRRPWLAGLLWAEQVMQEHPFSGEEIIDEYTISSIELKTEFDKGAQDYLRNRHERARNDQVDKNCVIRGSSS